MANTSNNTGGGGPSTRSGPAGIDRRINRGAKRKTNRANSSEVSKKMREEKKKRDQQKKRKEELLKRRAGTSTPEDTSVDSLGSYEDKDDDEDEDDRDLTQEGRGDSIGGTDALNEDGEDGSSYDDSFLSSAAGSLGARGQGDPENAAGDPALSHILDSAHARRTSNPGQSRYANAVSPTVCTAAAGMGTDEAAQFTPTVTSVDEIRLKVEAKITHLFSKVEAEEPVSATRKQLMEIVRRSVFPKLKFFDFEGLDLKTRRKEAGKFGSFDIPDVCLGRGFVITILKGMGMMEQTKTLEDRVRFWNTYKMDVKKCILQERSSKTQAIKDCLLHGKKKQSEFN